VRWEVRGGTDRRRRQRKLQHVTADQGSGADRDECAKGGGAAQWVRGGVKIHSLSNEYNLRGEVGAAGRGREEVS
jgi:hypothetical protein